MAYSRWGSSYWYTYWAASPVLDRDNQLFAICDVGHPLEFKYSDLKTDLQGCLQRVKEEYAREQEVEILKDALDVSKGSEIVTVKAVELDDKLLNELREYMEQFLKDVEEIFNVKYDI